MLDTIAAIATPIGLGAIGVVRLSGPEAFDIARAIFRTGGRQPECGQRGLHVGWVVDPVSCERLDEAVLLVFPGPKSFTTEDVVEIQGHAGPAVLGRVLRLVLAQGARLASPGEFTRRAFVGGRLDLAQAEAIADLVEARGDRALQAAIGQLEGRLSHAVSRTRQAVLELLARIEAAVDFPEDVPDEATREVAGVLADGQRDLERLLAGARACEVARSGARVALVGRPNVGKSSLFNALLQAERAIVTPLPGTTRDVLEADVEIGGLPLRLLDTAGIRPAQGAIEAEGVARSCRQLDAAELRLLVYDAEIGFGPMERELHERAGDRPTVLVANKVDLLSATVASPLPGLPHVAISARTGTGLEELERVVIETVLGGAAAAAPEIAVNARHRAALEIAAARFEAAMAALESGFPLDLLTGDLRAAALALGQITGADPVEDVLDLLFARFCVGK